MAESFEISRHDLRRGVVLALGRRIVMLLHLRPVDVTDTELEDAMRACRFEPAAAARQLGINRPSLYNMIRRHPTLRTAEDVPEEQLEEILEASDGRPDKAAERLEVSARALARRIARKG